MGSHCLCLFEYLFMSTGLTVNSKHYEKRHTFASPQVHLLIDTTLSESKFSIQAFMSRLLTLGDKVLATEFVEMPCEVLFGEAERVGGAMP